MMEGVKSTVESVQRVKKKIGCYLKHAPGPNSISAAIF